jgi:hypothetical protein
MRKSTGHMAWMLGLGWIAVLALGGCGAKSLPASRPAFLAPGKEWTIRVYTTMRTTTRGTRMEKQVSATPGGTITEEEVERKVAAPKTSDLWTNETGQLRTASTLDDGRLHLSATMTKLTVSPGYVGSKGTEAVIYDASTPDTGWWRSAFEDVVFPACVDEAGQLSNVDPPSGEHWKKERLDRPASPLFGRRVRYDSRGCPMFSLWTALEDIIAYWPPETPQLGQRWGGDREAVFPYHMYGFYMLTGGFGVMSETSTCEVVSIESRAGQQIATIQIAGRRKPFRMKGQSRPPGEEMDRVSAITLTGTMKVNLTTPAVESLELKSTLHFRSAEDRRMMQVEFHECLTLKPTPAKKQTAFTLPRGLLRCFGRRWFGRAGR